MILRNRKISESANEIQMHLSYSVPDVLQWCRELYDLCAVNPVVLKMGWSMEELINYFGETKFSEHKIKHKQSLARWCVATAVRKGYLIKSVEGDLSYFLAEHLKERPGRKPKAENNCDEC